GGRARRAVGGDVHADERGQRVEAVRAGHAEVAAVERADVDGGVVGVGDLEGVRRAAGGRHVGEAAACGRRAGGLDLDGADVRRAERAGQAALVRAQGGRVGAGVDERAARLRGDGPGRPAV